MMMRMTTGLSALALVALIHTTPMQAQGAMAKPGAMAAPAAAMSVSSLRMIAATCGLQGNSGPV